MEVLDHCGSDFVGTGRGVSGARKYDGEDSGFGNRLVLWEVESCGVCEVEE